MAASRNSVFIILLCLCCGQGKVLEESFKIFFNETKYFVETNLNGYIENLLHYHAINRMFSNVTHSKQRINSDSLTQNISLSLSKRINEVLDILIENAEKSKNYSITSNVPDAEICCSKDVKNISSFDFRFGTSIAHNACVGSTKSLKRYFDSNLRAKFKKNLKRTDCLLWQYLGGDDGYYMQYPSDNSSCSHDALMTDHRIRNWFVQTASSRKKNIVILLDSSGSMSVNISGQQQGQGQRRIDVAKAAAKAVVNALSPHDTIGIVSFSRVTESPPGCHSQYVEPATPATKQIMNSFIDGIQLKDDTYYGPAFQKGFDLLLGAKKHRLNQFQSSDDVILIVTDGIANEPPNVILDIIVQQQQKMNHSVHIFVYGLGDEIRFNQSKVEFLEKLADQNNMVGPNGNKLRWPILPHLQNNDKPVGGKGHVTFVAGQSNQSLDMLLGQYYRQFPLVKNNQISVSMPYQKGELKTPVITFGVPLYSNVGSFDGVIALDVSFELLFHEIIHFHHGRGSYALLTTDSGDVLCHSEYYKRKPDFLEGSYTLFSLEPSLTHSDLKNVTVKTNNMDSLQITRLSKTYYLRCLDTGHNLSLVLIVVVQSGCDEEDIQSLGNVGPIENVLIQTSQDMIQLTDSSSDQCLLNNILVNKNGLTTTVVPGMFKNPNEQLYANNITNNLASNMTEFNTTSEFADAYGLTLNAAIEAYLTRDVKKYFRTRGEFLWRYLGTSGGLFKIYPAVLVRYPIYDPRNDMWYQESVDNLGNFIIHISDNITSISRALAQNETDISGVIALDMSSNFWQNILNNLLFACSSNIADCFLLDNKGYMVYSSAQNKITYEHIAKSFPYITSMLMQERVLQVEVCQDLLDHKEVLSYHISLNQTLQHDDPDKCGSFVMASIQSTNLYLLSVPPCIGQRHPNFQCSCTEVCHECDHSQQQLTCQCPCECPRQNQSCHGNSNSSLVLKVCKGHTGHWRNVAGLLSLQVERQNNTQKCEEKCSDWQNQTECEMHVPCMWCGTGYSKDVAVCTSFCVVDRVNLTYIAGCDLEISNISVLWLENKIFKEFLHHIKTSYQNLSLESLTFNGSHSDGLHFTMTLAGEMNKNIPTDVLTQLNSNVIVINGSSLGQTKSNSINFYPKKSHHNRMSFIINIKDYNFTLSLETAPTLRSFMIDQVKEKVAKTLPWELSHTIQDIWFYDNAISFTLEMPNKNVSHEDIANQLRGAVAFASFSIFDEDHDVRNITTKLNVPKPCSTFCSQIISPDDCNTSGACKWTGYYDFYNKSNTCDAFAILPERQVFTVYIPCLGLYDRVPATTEQYLLQEFEKKIRLELFHLSPFALHSFSIFKDADDIGYHLNFTIQGTTKDPPVSRTVWLIKQKLAWHQRWSISDGRTEFYSSVRRYSKDSFTDIQVTLRSPGFDFDAFLQAHAMSGRATLANEVAVLAARYFIPSVALTLRNVQAQQNLLQFMVSAGSSEDYDLRQEYSRLMKNVVDGHVTLTFDDVKVNFNDAYVVGSFYGLCPRPCHKATSKTVCSNIPDCAWSDRDSKCSRDNFLPEMLNVTIVFQCGAFRHKTSAAKFNNITGVVNDYISVFVTKTFNLSSRAVHSFREGLVPDSLQFSLQTTPTGPSLDRLYSSLVSWLDAGHVQFTLDSTTFLGSSIHLKERFELSVLYNISIQKEDIDIVKAIKRDIEKQIYYVLPLNYFVIDSILVDQEACTVLLKRNSTNTKTLQDVTLALKSLIKIGGLGVVVNNKKDIPIELKGRVRYASDCNFSCTNRTKESCSFLHPCSWIRDQNYCAEDEDLPWQRDIDLFLPCNVTQRLSDLEKESIVSNVKDRLKTQLSQIFLHNLRNVSFIGSGVRVHLVATRRFSELDVATHQVRDSLDMKSGFAVLVLNRTRIYFREPTDFTNFKIHIGFKNIDFDLLKRKYSIKRLEGSLHSALGTFMPMLTLMYLNVHNFSQNGVEFSLRKTVGMATRLDHAVEDLKQKVNEDKFTLNIRYVRPVMASNIIIEGSFEEICPDGNFNSSLNSTTPAVQILPPQETHKAHVLLVYNQSEAGADVLQTYLDPEVFDSCMVEVKDSPKVISTSFAKHTCSFPHVATTEGPGYEYPAPTATKSPEAGVVIGPVGATVIAVGAGFLLALAFMVAQGLYNLNKDGDSPRKEDNSSSDSIEMTEQEAGSAEISGDWS